ncbi:MAG: hypothetical protein ACYTFW_00630 [Planctomycetota bacterium]|jgi:hypothetical protein
MNYKKSVEKRIDDLLEKRSAIDLVYREKLFDVDTRIAINERALISFEISNLTKQNEDDKILIQHHLKARFKLLEQIEMCKQQRSERLQEVEYYEHMNEDDKILIQHHLKARFKLLEQIEMCKQQRSERLQEIERLHKDFEIRKAAIRNLEKQLDLSIDESQQKLIASLIS